MPYVFGKELKRSSLGRVFDSVKQENGKHSAVIMLSHVLAKDAAYRAAFLTEVKELRKLNHPGIARITDEPFFDKLNNIFLPTERVEGESLEEVVRNKGGRLNATLAANIMLQILDPLKYLHEVGKVAHRNLKPANILIRKDGSVCLTNFGIAKDTPIMSKPSEDETSGVDANYKTAGHLMGIDAYTSPEQVEGQNIDFSADLYALGGILYFMLTGEHPFQECTTAEELEQAILTAKRTFPSQKEGVQEDTLDEICAQMMDASSKKRFATAKAVDRAICNAMSWTYEVKIGTSDDNDIQINEEFVSHHHLRIHASDEETALYIRDDSTNGTEVNGLQINRKYYILQYKQDSELPVVKLAGNPDCILDWQKVISCLQEKGWEVPSPTTSASC